MAGQRSQRPPPLLNCLVLTEKKDTDSIIVVMCRIIPKRRFCIHPLVDTGKRSMSHEDMTV